jgi:hypothetical protein
MLTFNNFLTEAESETSMILNREGPPLFLSPTMFKRVFNIPDKEALHLISTKDLLFKFPKVVGKAKQISTFTFLAPGSTFYKRGVEIGAYPPDAFVHVKGRVSGMFNYDIYSSILKKGGRAIELNPDTVEDSEFPDEMEDLANDLRDLVKKTMGGDYPFDKSTLDGKQKQELIKNYITTQEILISSKKYKEVVADWMVDMVAVGDTKYNEITMDKVRPIAIYLKGDEHAADLKKMYKVPVKTNVSEYDIIQLTKKL